MVANYQTKLALWLLSRMARTVGFHPTGGGFDPPRSHQYLNILFPLFSGGWVSALKQTPFLLSRVRGVVPWRPHTAQTRVRIAHPQSL